MHRSNIIENIVIFFTGLLLSVTSLTLISVVTVKQQQQTKKTINK